MLGLGAAQFKGHRAAKEPRYIHLKRDVSNSNRGPVPARGIIQCQSALRGCVGVAILPNVIHLRTGTAGRHVGPECAVANGDGARPLEFCHRVRNIFAPPEFMAFHRERQL